MKKISSLSTVVAGLAGIALCFTLFSFASRFGGDSYTIFLNDKQVAQRYVASKMGIPSLSLDTNNSNDQLSVYYSECGKIGKARTLSIRNDQNKMLKEWKFADVGDDHTPMAMKSKEIAALAQDGSKLSVYYSSEQVPDGRLLANLTIISKDSKASR